MPLSGTSLVMRLRRMAWARTAAPWAWLARDVVRIRRSVGWALPDAFDDAYGVRTRVVPPLAQLFRTARLGGFEHEPSSPDAFRMALDSLDVDVTQMVFVDYGSGAGRAVLMASTYPFREVVGIELAPWLHARAQANVRAFPAEAVRAGAIRLVCANAAAFELPPDPAVLYLYNPFGAGVMRQVRANIEASLARHPRPITIILASCYKEPRAVITASAALRVVSVSGQITLLRSVIAAEALRPAPDRSRA